MFNYQCVKSNTSLVWKIDVYGELISICISMFRASNYHPELPINHRSHLHAYFIPLYLHLFLILMSTSTCGKQPVSGLYWLVRNLLFARNKHFIFNFTYKCASVLKKIPSSFSGSINSFSIKEKLSKCRLIDSNKFCAYELELRDSVE